ncbi:phosphatidate cytidylyltransferase [bacterium]|nr:phosphatidate cytidylyltransferase [bacterium]
MKDRALSTLGLWAAVGLVIYGFGRFNIAQLGGFLVILALGLAAQYELYRILEKSGARPRIGVGLVAGAILMVAVFLSDAGIPAALNYAALAWVAVLLTLLRRPLVDQAWVLRFATAFGVLYVPALLAFFVDFARWKNQDNNHGLWIALWVVAVTKFTDVGGLLFGVPFGRHKIAPNISPAKSLEGCLGGVALSVGVGVGLAALYAQAGLLEIPLGKAALLALPLALLSVPSDLVESYLKRRAGVKDSGTTIPGIGGALDLIDSLLLVAPVGFLLFKTLTHIKVG